MSIEESFNSRCEDVRYNTSYPLMPADWEKYRYDGALSFDGETDLCFYLHVPFCKSLCKFCEYIRYPKPAPELERQYVNQLSSDVKDFTVNHEVTLHGFDIGGGTPTVLDFENFKSLVAIYRDIEWVVKYSDDIVPSIEGSFQTIDNNKIAVISYGGFKRISFGLQTVNAAFLKESGRDNGSLARMKDVFKSCRHYGIKVVNLDLMYGFSGQSDADLSATLQTVSELMPEHLTVYELRCNMQNHYDSKSKDELYRQYCVLYDGIRGLGYSGEFGSNTFSLIGDKGLSSYLEKRMVGGMSYKGFGISAQSMSLQGISYNIGKRHLAIEECMRSATFERGGDTYLLPRDELLAKYVAISGYHGSFSLSHMKSIMCADPLSIFAEQFDFLTSRGFIRIDNDEVRITRAGFRNYGAILSLFYPERIFS